MASPPYSRFTLLVNDLDLTDLLIPESFRLISQADQGVRTSIEYRLKQVGASFGVEGGAQVVVYLPQASVPVFVGHQTKTQINRYGPSSWQYQCQATGIEEAFRRKQLFTSLRGVTYEGAVNQILGDPDQTWPTGLSLTVINTAGVLSDAMPFFAVNGAYPAEVFDLIANLTSTLWRITITGPSTTQLEFFDPFKTPGGLALTQSSQTFRWDTFLPEINLTGVVNSQSVQGSQTALETQEVAYFRGDGLSSKFDLPTTPFNNTASVVVYDSFNAQPVNTGLWLESDVVGNKVYADGGGFVQYEASGGVWTGLISKGLAERSGAPMMLVDLTWVSGGEAMWGFTLLNAVPSGQPLTFLEAGFYVNALGQVFGVSNGTITGSTSLTLSPSTQYRFRVRLNRTHGCVVEYQAGANIYTRTWTVVASSNTGSGTQLASSVMAAQGNFALALVKTTYPYLGVKLEVDRGTGFVEETVGVYPMDEDVDAVILDESVLAFFGSDPGPSTIPPIPTWNDSSDYKNIRVTYSRGVSIFATYQDSSSIAAMAALFGGSDSGIREGAVIQDPTITSYSAALARAKTEVLNRSNLLERLVAESSLNTLTTAGTSLPEVGKTVAVSVTLPTTNYLIEKTMPLRLLKLTGKRGLNDLRVELETGYLNRGLRLVLSELQASGKVISISENQVLYFGKSISEPVALTEAVTTLGGSGLANTRAWGDSRLSRTFTVNTTTDLLTTPSSSLLATGDPVRVSSDDTLPSPLSASTLYYLNRQSATTYYLYDTLANAQTAGPTGRLNLTTGGSGTHTLWPWGFRWGWHKWGSFAKAVELKSEARVAVTARTYKRWEALGRAVLNIRARVV